MPTKLTDNAIKRTARECATDGERREMADENFPGLRIRLTPSGVKSWVLGLRDSLGRQRRFALGNYPTLGIAEAREAARVTRHQVKHEGGDPIAANRRMRALGKAAKGGVGTLRELLETYSRT